MRKLPIVVACSAFASASAFAGYAYQLPEPGFPQCVGVQIKPDTWNDATLTEVANLGFKIVRRGIYWSAVEKEKGVYDFSKFDAQMKTCKELGLTVIVCLFGNNNGLYEDPSNKAITTEAARQGYAAFAAAAAAHYADQPIVWEIWNEPNVQTFWRKGQHNSPEFAKEYSDLVNLTVPEMLKANPEAFVVAGSVSNYWEPSYQWTESCFKNGVLKSGIKGWSVHPYGVKTPEEFKVGHDRTKALLKQYGAPELPIVDTERGFTAQKNDDITLEGWSGGDLSKVNDYQAWHIVRQYLVDQIEGIGFTSWYELKGNEGFSLYRDGKPAPALEAFRTMMKELDGYRFVRLVKTESERDRLAIFVNKEGARKLVAWTTPVPGGSPDETKEHDVIVKLGAVDAAVVNLRGQQTPAAIGLGLHLTGAPQYVALAKDQDPVAAVNLGLATFPAVQTSGSVAVGQGAPAPTASAKPAKPAAAKPAKPAKAGKNLNTAPEAAELAEAKDLALFTADAGWNFIPNTGKGDITAADGLAKLNYDFSESKAQGVPYVLASVPVDIAAGSAILYKVRTSVPGQKLTMRITDATGQTLQFKTKLKGTGDWETVKFPLNKKIEHWEGENDGFTHYPVKSFCLSVPKSGDTLTGTLEFSEAVVK